jgi:outer membrane receptor for ferrienterochelin and colicin
MLKRISFFAAVLCLGVLAGNAQVTTSSIAGVVLSEQNEPLVGASVTALHTPTGSKYTTVSVSGGRFNIPNIVPGGPYTISVTYVGLTAYEKRDIMIPLGDKYELSVPMTAQARELETVVLASSRSAVVKNGAATNISNRTIQTIANPARTITGVTKLTPQSNGNSFAGLNYRFNNITIDGSLFNNNFGRSGDGFVPGGASTAISIDAIDQIQVNISPFDVRQAGFVGGGVNAVTRRGTNNWYGTVYGFYRNQNFNGEKVNGQTISNAKRSVKTFGASVGGPIIQNKLFFFINAETEKRTNPGQTWLARRPGITDGNPQVTPVLASDLDNLKAFLISQYNYDPGIYEGYDFLTENKKILGRIDWTISDKHRLTLRYTHSETDDDDQINNTSRPAGAAAINNGRRGGPSSGLAYNGSNFKNNTVVKSGVVELNSQFSKRFSNQLLASYTDNRPVRVPNSDGVVPFVDIMSSSSNVYISFGTELFSYKNEIIDKALNIADNVSITLGKHALTVGASYEYLQFENSFTSGAGPGYYRYASLQDFLDKKAPSFYAIAYDPTNPKSIKVPKATFAQLGVYLQDSWNASTKFRLTYGVRLDRPAYPYKPDRNPALEAVTFQDENGRPEKFDVSKWPEAKILVSPRVGFTYDVNGNKDLIVRGGTGVFTGRIPFIWLVNQVGDNGVIRAQYTASGAELAAIRYNTNRETYLPATGSPVTTIPSGSSYSATARDFKMPQVWRTNLAIDKRLAPQTTFTLEAIFTKMINNVYYRNANLGNQNGTLGGAVDKRPYYNTRLNSNISQMIVLDNINKGMSFALTPQLQKSFSKNWEAMIAYTFTYSTDVAAGTSDQAASGWNINQIVNNPNRPEYGNASFAIPHRIVAFAAKRFEYLKKKMATTVSLYYSAGSQERYVYRYTSDINGDGQFNDMIYIPKDASEITFVEGLRGSNGQVYTAAQQRDAFFTFIDNDKYLKKHKGQYMDRFGGLLPWVHTLDLRLLQDFTLIAGGKRHTLQFSADLTNFLNLLNSRWGYRYSYRFGGFSDQGILGVPTATNNTGAETFNRNTPKFTFDPAGLFKVHQPNYSTASAWGLQLGLRYTFN